MAEREILLVENDSKVRKQMADSFRKEGYRVEATDSTADLLGTLLQKQVPVVMLGSGSDGKIALAKLVPLLKRYNRGVSIILVSDEEALPTYRSIRQEGIFYHALKPTGQEDTEEILAAVACAFNKAERMAGKHADRAVAHQETAPVVELACGVSPVPAEVPAESPAAVAFPPAVEPRHVRDREGMWGAKAVAVWSALGVALAGLIWSVAAAVGGGGSDLAVSAFLGFIALIAVCRLLPACLSARAAGKFVAQRLQDDLAVAVKQEQAEEMPDKN
jgi:FixJ family two-component response regulator